MRRREFLTLVGGILPWPLKASAQRTAMLQISLVVRLTCAGALDPYQ